MSRTYFVKFNIDSFRDDLAKLDGQPDAAYRDWIRGFNRGVSGMRPEDESGALLMGMSMGYDAYQNAEDFREKQAEKGKLSARKRSTTVEPRLNQASTNPPTGHPTGGQVASSQKPVASNDKPEASNDDTPAASLDSLKKSGAHMTRRGESIAGEWEYLLGVYPMDRIKQALAKKAPKDKWPSQVRTILEFEDSGGSLEEIIQTPEETMAFLKTCGITP